MSLESEAGLQALQQGDASRAIPLLETACQQNPNDYNAFLYLGAAYGQAGRQMDAITTITKAVQLQPANAQARYNLGIAMEQGGYREQAIQALQQALTLQPHYPKAQETLSRLQSGGSLAGGAGAVLGPSSAPVYSAAPAANPAHGQPTPQAAEPFQSPNSLPPDDPSVGSEGQTPLYSQPAPSGARVYEQPVSNEAPTSSALPAFGIGQAADSLQPAPAYQPPGNIGPPSVEQPQSGNPNPNQPPAYGQSAYGSPYAPQAPPPAYGQPPTPNTYGSSAYSPNVSPQYRPPMSPYSAERPSYRQDVPDSFDLLQALKDWGRVIISPAAFFQDQSGRTGLMAPLALLFLYAIVLVLSSLIHPINPAQTPGVPPQIVHFLMAGGMLLIMAIVVSMIALSLFLFAFCVHLVGLLFGNTAPYSASFRAVVYSYAPTVVLGVINSLIIAAAGLSAQGLTGIIGLCGLIWAIVLLCIAISNMQQLSGGAAFGVVILSIIAYLVLFIAFIFTLVFIILLMVGVAAGASHALLPFR